MKKIDLISIDLIDLKNTRCPKIRKKKYDLEERTARFAENIIQCARKIPKDTVTVPLIEAARIPRPLGGGDEWPHNECAPGGARLANKKFSVPRLIPRRGNQGTACGGG